MLYRRAVLIYGLHKTGIDAKIYVDKRIGPSQIFTTSFWVKRVKSDDPICTI